MQASAETNSAQAAATGSSQFIWSAIIMLFAFSVAVLIKILVPTSSLLLSFYIATAHGLPNYFFFLYLTKKYPKLPAWLAVSAAMPVGISIGTSTGYLIYQNVALHSAIYFPLSLFDYLLLGLIFSSIASLMFYWRGQMLLAMEAQQANMLKLANQEKLLVESQLRALQAQIEPHFLFNTLANVQGLIDADPKAAKQMLESFTRLLRHTLQRSRKSDTNLGQELEIVHEYLSIQKQRLGNRLHFYFKVDQSLNQFPFPPLLLQPLVENAIRHGIEPSLTGGTINIEISRIDMDRRPAILQVKVIDTGQGFDEHGSQGVGLANVRDRLNGTYGPNAKLIMAENHPHGVIAILEVPIA